MGAPLKLLNSKSLNNWQVSTSFVIGNLDIGEYCDTSIKPKRILTCGPLHIHYHTPYHSRTYSFL